MNQVKANGFTKQMARNMFYGGSLFFILLFVALIFDSERKIPIRSNAEALTESVIKGKKLWESRNCIGCHTLLGEGAYFAPELGNVQAPRPGLHQGLDCLAAHPHSGSAPNAAIQFHRGAVERPDRVSAMDGQYQHAKLATEH